MKFCRNVHFNGQKFSIVLEQFSITPKFLGLKCKHPSFKTKMDLSVVLKMRCMRLQTGLFDLIKH